MTTISAFTNNRMGSVRAGIQGRSGGPITTPALIDVIRDVAVVLTSLENELSAADRPGDVAVHPLGDDELVTVRQAADLLRIGRTTVYKLIKEGRLPVVRFSSDLRIRLGDLRRLIAESVLPPGGR